MAALDGATLIDSPDGEGTMLEVELPQYVEETYAAELLAGCAGGIGYLLEGSREPGRRIPLPPSDSGHRRVLAVPAYLNP